MLYIIVVISIAIIFIIIIRDVIFLFFLYYSFKNAQALWSLRAVGSKRRFKFQVTGYRLKSYWRLFLMKNMSRCRVEHYNHNHINIILQSFIFWEILNLKESTKIHSNCRPAQYFADYAASLCLLRKNKNNVCSHLQHYYRMIKQSVKKYWGYSLSCLFLISSFSCQTLCRRNICKQKLFRPSSDQMFFYKNPFYMKEANKSWLKGNYRSVLIFLKEKQN